jgi:hypothetical protein
MIPTRPARTIPASAPLDRPLGVELDRGFDWVGDALDLDVAEVLEGMVLVAAKFLCSLVAL